MSAKKHKVGIALLIGAAAALSALIMTAPAGAMPAAPQGLQGRGIRSPGSQGRPRGDEGRQQGKDGDHQDRAHASIMPRRMRQGVSTGRGALRPRPRGPAGPPSPWARGPRRRPTPPPGSPRG